MGWHLSKLFVCTHVLLLIFVSICGFSCSIRNIKTNFMGFCLKVVTFEFPVIGNTDTTAFEISMVEDTSSFNIRLKFLCDKGCVPYLRNVK